MFHPIATTWTHCDVEVSVFEGRYVVEGREVGSTIAEVAEAIREASGSPEGRGCCPIPVDCATEAQFRLVG